MATIALGVAGGALGGAIGGSIWGGTAALGAFAGTSYYTSGALIGAFVGKVAGATLGAYVDQTVILPALFGRNVPNDTGPKVDDFQITLASEGTPISFIMGTARVGCHIFWSDPIEIVKHEEPVSGKGTGTDKINTYEYFGTFAFSICEGEVEEVIKVWCDAKLVYDSGGSASGDEDETPTNLLQYSNRFENPVWVKDFSVNGSGGFPGSAWFGVEDDAGAPNPSLPSFLTALVYHRQSSIFWTTTNSIIYQEVDVEPSTQYTFSVYTRTRLDGGTEPFDIQIRDVDNVVLFTFNVGSLPLGWNRPSITFTTGATTSRIRCVVYYRAGTTATSEANIQAAQLIEGAGPLDYEDTGGDGVDGRYDELVFYPGSATQAVDPVIEAAKGVGETPAYRHLAYGRFTRLSLADFGNRLPTITALVRQQGSMKLVDAITTIINRSSEEPPVFGFLGIDDRMRGFNAAGPQSAFSLISNFILANDLTIHEEGSSLIFSKRGVGDVIVLDVADFSIDGRLMLVEIGENDKPARLSVNYIDPSIDYQRGNQTATRIFSSAEDPQSVEVPIVLTGDEANALANKLLATTWAEKYSAGMTLPPQFIYLTEGSLLRITQDEEVYNLRLTRVAQGANYLIEVEGVIEDSDSIYQDGSSDDNGGHDGGGPYVPPAMLLVAAELPPLQQSHVDKVGFYFGAAAADRTLQFRGAELYEGLNLDDMVNVATISAEATLVKLLSFIPPTTTFDDWDEVTAVEVEVVDGQLFSRSEAEVIAGNNWVLLGPEIIAFCNATLIGSNRYRLTKLARGVRGTSAFNDLHNIGELGLILNSTFVQWEERSSSMVGDTYYFKCVPVGKTVGESPQSGKITYLDIAHTPLPPVLQAGSVDLAGHWTFTWEPESRNVHPLFEHDDDLLTGDLDEYEVEIYNYLGEVASTNAVTGRLFVYTVAAQTADGLFPGYHVTARIRQKSTIVPIGLGYKRKFINPDF
jgi:hypothetical protein